MLYSMTGYGQGTATDEGITAFVEVKSVNARYFEPSLRLPPIVSAMEADFIDVVRQFVHRGRIMLTVQISNSANTNLWNISFDENLLDMHISLLERIGNKFIPEQTVVSLDRFLTFSELFIKTPEPKTQRFVLRASLAATSEAMKKLRSSRRQEGGQLQKDIQKRISSIKNIVRRIHQLHNNYTPSRFKKLRESVEQFASNIDVDPIRLAQEVAYIASKADCTEEIVRLETHIARLEKAVKSRKPVGSMLNFTLQECHRETNTIGSKTDIPEAASLVIDLKEEFERVKEQIQNVE